MASDESGLAIGKTLLARVSEFLGTDVPLYLVGGCVRDLLLGKIPKDYDFSTPLLPDEIENRIRIAGKKAYAIGKRFGTIGFRLDEHFIEITTFRHERYNSASRKPVVTFVPNLEDDLARRDFTINAMAMVKDAVIDMYGGAADLRLGIIRAVGDPKQRFTEDPLRILRMIRFIARFGFTIDAETAEQSTACARKLEIVAHERIATELDQIIMSPFSIQALQRMAELGILPYALPLLAIQVRYDQQTPYHKFDLWDHSIKTLERTQADLTLRWAALLHDVGKPFARAEKAGRMTYVGHDSIGERLCRMVAFDLRWPKDRTDAVAELVRNHMQEKSPLRQSDNAAKA